MTPLSTSVLERELRSIFTSPKFDLETETVKTIRKKITKRLDLDEFPADSKQTLKKLVQRFIQEHEEANNDDSTSKSENEEKDLKPKQSPKKTKPKKKKTRTKKTAPTKQSSSASSLSYDSSVHALLDFGKAMGMGPNLYRGLKTMSNDEERAAALTDRLKEAGASWRGSLPSSKDIAKAKAEKQRKNDLDGLDTSLILETSRRRKRAVVNYSTNYGDDEENHSEDNVNQDGKEAPRKITSKKKDNSSTDDSDNESFGGSESSEAEFN
mmetsp:Transcript_19578/g.29035  ORF Transcript_19578/g.29035 Transcript_19578/m.29035 type:complete len:268 (-) Transcript_19578:273-1076(-)|eukprot:CAMPEP_0194219852 /NCGR_PEP_ID=MMETSP0156-20130528/26997_1 /TAXON_ID=33649 /ORGANISM="Thalassionema nitzschioides, Strain L26-B" /LENGTH=267 /DNA_ID=CAMNT_0038949665 /DNA_START=21 /DNA_END=824 /DNA_ORIENTATION=-